MNGNQNSEEPVSNRNIESRDAKDSKKCTYYKDFAANTSLHGVKYTSEDERSMMERIWWAIMVICSFCICVYLVGQVWHKWVTSPVIVSFDENLTPVWKIPFPGITVCPMSKTDSTVFNYSNICESEGFESNDQEEMFNLVSFFCEVGCLKKLPKARAIQKDTLEKFKNVSLPIQEVFALCMVRNDLVNCADILVPVLTDLGMCYTINTLNAQDIYSENAEYDNFYLNGERNVGDWSLDTGYPKNTPFETYPRRIKSSSKAAFTFVLKNRKKHLDYWCSSIIEGLSVIVHPPHAPPRSFHYEQSPYGNIVNVEIKPSMMFTSKGLQSYKPEDRQCYFSYERELKFFKNYTREHCEAECFANYTLAVCGCVSPSMPRDSSMPMCSGGSKICVDDASGDFTLIEKNEKLPPGLLQSQLNETKRDALKAAINCNCMQSCTSLSYETKYRNVKTDMVKFLKPIVTSEEMLKIINIDEMDISWLQIYVNNPHFIMSKRSELYGITDFLANCGGLIGVCLGFSILSLIEIIYFFVIRVICDMKNKKKHSSSVNCETYALRPSY